MPKKSRPLNLDDFDAIDWDAEDDPTGNHAHCAEHGIDEHVVDEVLRGDWVDVELPVDTAEFAIVGPNAKENFMWTLLFHVDSTLRYVLEARRLAPPSDRMGCKA